jgi:hypothetical protein
MARPSPLYLLPAALLVGACIVEAPGGASPNERRQAVVTQVPPLSVSSGANFDGKVELVGASFQPARPAPGDLVRVTAYFKVLAPMEEDYTIFVHAEDTQGRLERINSDHRPANGLYPTPQWKVGETIKDEFSFHVPAGSNLQGLNVWIGFWEPQGDSRLPLRNTDSVRNDGRNRVLLAQLPVGP